MRKILATRGESENARNINTIGRRIIRRRSLREAMKDT
jgi:hypothetical protein